MKKMYLNELDNFHFDLPSQGTAPQVAAPAGGWGDVPLVGSVEDAPQIGSLSPADTELFKGVIAKYFAEEDPLC
ncbi:MAG: hypothetical protein SPL58_09130, partial [Bacteroidaceae bacterium]|nr:hypothetical protein [Bacteroidaceae bacterium]